MCDYIIGIDLGTTNCTVAYTKKATNDSLDNPPLVQFPILQIMGNSTVFESFSLPSCLYFPLKEELEAQQDSLEGISRSDFCVGDYAKKRGSELPDRVITSAKSWLCHSGIDRRGPILPVGEDSIVPKMSPLEVSSHLLRHIREAWDLKMPNVPFAKQQILITVPASFDPSARQLVQEAAEMASYPEVILLEEPQAAFYAWLSGQGQNWRKLLTVGDVILVIDIGGGTTDFSLISVTDNNGQLGLERLAVGAHLLLGGDNIDLGLAYLAKEKLEKEGHAIDEWQMQALVYSCRQAKETLLGDHPPQTTDLIIPSRGSRLIGGSLKTNLTKEEVEKFVLEGFFPLVESSERSLAEKRSGLQQLGLPYAQDPRISCQLAKFLSMTGELDSSDIDRFVMPSAVLFNGGTLKASQIRDRLLMLLNQWAKSFHKSMVKILPEPDYDFAVSRGASYYALAREGKALRIKSGTSRSYFIGVEEAVPAVPGISPRLSAVCVVPFGMEEGSERLLENQQFSLLLGEQATFRFFSHSTRTLVSGIEPVLGTNVKSWKEELKELHPIETVLAKREGDGKVVRVSLRSHVTELGTLELWCVSTDGRKWKLEFDLRNESFS